MKEETNYFSYSKGESKIATIIDFWRFHFSNEWALMSEISEFLVAKALKIDLPSNKDYWTLFDIDYNGIKVEVKETAYCHSWNKVASKAQRVFGIEKSYGYRARVQENYKRYSDVYVFCFNTIKDRDCQSPLNADTWEFYIVKTSVVDDLFGDQKKLSLGRLSRLVKAGKAIKCDYQDIKDNIDKIFSK